MERRAASIRGAGFRRTGIKSADIIKPNPWRRRKNRDFCAEVVRLLRVSGATTYAVTIEKGRMNHPMALSTSMPLQLQILAEHFAAECETLGRVGMIIADWSGHQHDQHASECVASFVASCACLCTPPFTMEAPTRPKRYRSQTSSPAYGAGAQKAMMRWRPLTRSWPRFG
jgi:hypothetical protein